MSNQDLRDATIDSLRRQLAVSRMEVENKNERIQSLLQEIQNLEDQLREANYSDNIANRR